MENIHKALDLLGCVPVYGELADGTNAVLYFAEADYVNAALSAGAMIPVAGYGAAGIKIAKGAGNVEKAAIKNIQVPGRVQSRINLQNEGCEHVINRHFNSSQNASQFTVTQGELRELLQSEQIVKTPISRILESEEGPRYVREISVDRVIGLDKFNGFQPTSTLTVLTDIYGNLITATPGVIR